ncbi:MAG: transglycosylase SLT domain-containing protein [Prevotellaceae bacterium]|jgi:hypothetical protein|nr:transglycosylase SLT domain-containing protein [Prevotellaceae bacterium]
MIYEEYIPNSKTAFIAKVQQISRQLGINPDWLMVVMYAESRLNPAAYNKSSGASGLIQFMPSTAVGLGTTTAALRQMTNVAQLDYVYKYFKNYSGRINSVYDLYKIVFFPAMLGKPADWVLQTSTLSASAIAKANKIIDANNDSKITVAEFEQYVDKYLKKKM